MLCDGENTKRDRVCARCADDAQAAENGQHIAVFHDLVNKGRWVDKHFCGEREQQFEERVGCFGFTRRRPFCGALRLKLAGVNFRARQFAQCLRAPDVIAIGMVIKIFEIVGLAPDVLNIFQDFFSFFGKPVSMRVRPFSSTMRKALTMERDEVKVGSDLHGL